MGTRPVSYPGPTYSLVPRLLHRQAGREPGRFDHVPHDVACVVLIIELLPTQSDSKYCPALYRCVTMLGSISSQLIIKQRTKPRTLCHEARD